MWNIPIKSYEPADAKPEKLSEKHMLGNQEHLLAIHEGLNGTERWVITHVLQWPLWHQILPRFWGRKVQRRAHVGMDADEQLLHTYTLWKGNIFYVKTDNSAWFLQEHLRNVSFCKESTVHHQKHFFIEAWPLHPAAGSPKVSSTPLKEHTHKRWI